MARPRSFFDVFSEGQILYSLPQLLDVEVAPNTHRHILEWCQKIVSALLEIKGAGGEQWTRIVRGGLSAFVKHDQSVLGLPRCSWILCRHTGRLPLLGFCAEPSRALPGGHSLDLDCQSFDPRTRSRTLYLAWAPDSEFERASMNTALCLPLFQHCRLLTL